MLQFMHYVMFVIILALFLTCEFICALPGYSITDINGTNESTVNESKREMVPLHIRIKRQQPGGGVGNFAEAAKMPQMKGLRLFLQMFKNMWAGAYLGGSHPLHPNVPKIFMELYHEKVEKVFFPPAGGDPDKRPET